MKLKLIAAITAAFVMVAGLAHGQEEISGIYYSENFSAYTNGATISDMNAIVEAEGTEGDFLGQWTSGEADMSKIVDKGSNKVLSLDTAGDVVTNALFGAQEAIDALNDGATVDISATMTFIPSDEIEPSFVDAYSAGGDFAVVDNGDLKFGLYAYEYDVTKMVTVDGVETPVIEVVTNLVIYHSYYQPVVGEGDDACNPCGYTNNVINITEINPNAANIFAEEKNVTVTLKSFGDELFFKVAIEGLSDVITSPLGCSDAAFSDEKLASTISPVPDGGCWFRTVQSADNNDIKISALNFSGTGEISYLEVASDAGGEGGDPDPEPTVIKLVKLNVTGDMVNGSLPTFTATVTDSEGKTVDASNYRIDASAIDMNKAGLYPVIITATGDDFQGVITNYYAVMSPTWFNGTPTQKALIDPENVTLSGIHYMHTSQDRAYLAINGENGDGNGIGHLLYAVDTLKSLYGTCQGVWEVAHNTSTDGKGMAANTNSGIMLSGRSKGGVDGMQSQFTGYDISDLDNIGTATNMVGETYTAEWAGSGYESGQVMDGLDFNYTGTKVFGNNGGTDGPWVYQFAIDKATKTMTWEHTYTTDFGRVRSVSSYYIDGKDYIFAGEGASSGRGEVVVIDPSDESITTICVAADDFTTDEFPSGRYFTNIKVSGIASGEMYLYGSTDKGEVLVWALGHNATTGEWMTAPVGNITSAQTAALCSKDSVANCRAFEVSDDNTAAFLYAQLGVSNTRNQFAVVTDISLAQRKALASATLAPASSEQDVALGAITATVIDENGDAVDASEYTINTNAINIAEVGEYTVTITPVEGSVYSNAVTAVYTISEASAAGFNDPEGNAITDTAVLDWLTSKGATQAQIDALGSAAALNEKYLLNIDLENSFYSLKIKSLTVGDDVKVEVDLVRSNATAEVSAAINGELQLWGTADLGTDFADCGLTEINNDDFSAGTTAVKSFTPEAGVKFFKAVIVAPTAAE